MILDKEENSKKRNRLILWLKRIGVVGFIFFLLKGLAWLAAAYFILK